MKLAKSHVTLKTYIGQKITRKGEMKCIVKFKGQEKELTLQVVGTPGPALFGRDWLSKIQLDWGEIKALKLSQTPEGVMQHKVDQLLQKYESVFSEGVGTLKGHKANLKVEEGCQPSFQKPRQVPYALRPRVEVELTRLEEDGILSKVEYSEYNGISARVWPFQGLSQSSSSCRTVSYVAHNGFFCEFGWGRTF